MVDSIVKVIELKASISRVWRAISDHNEFGEWFRVDLNEPFEPGVVSTGKMTFPGYEHYKWRAIIERVEPESLLSFRWHDYDETSDLDVSKQGTMLVEFHLEPMAGGTRLTITESGFESLPDGRRSEVFRENTEGWNIQAKHLTAYVS